MKKCLILITAIFLAGCKDSNSESINTSGDTTVQEITVAKTEINFSGIDIVIGEVRQKRMC